MSLSIGLNGSTIPNQFTALGSGNSSSSPQGKSVTPQANQKNDQLKQVPSGQIAVLNTALIKAAGGSSQKSNPNTNPAVTIPRSNTEIRTRFTFDNKVQTRVQVTIPQDKNTVVTLQGNINGKGDLGARFGIVNTTKLDAKTNFLSEIGVGIGADKGIDGNVGINHSFGKFFRTSVKAEGKFDNNNKFSSTVTPQIGFVLNSLEVNAGIEKSLTNGSSNKFIDTTWNVNEKSAIEFRFGDDGARAGFKTNF